MDAKEYTVLIEANERKKGKGAYEHTLYLFFYLFMFPIWINIFFYFAIFEEYLIDSYGLN